MFRVLRQIKLKNIDKHLVLVHITGRSKKCTVSMSSLLANASFLTKKRYFSQEPNTVFKEVDSHTFDKVCEETLDSLTEFFEELIESNEKLKSGDVTLSSGVLTVHLGNYGTYVINRQGPNKQIWLSSPKSGPKRYDYVPDGSYWIYKHNFKTLHELLQNELSSILGETIDMSNCAHYKVN